MADPETFEMYIGRERDRLAKQRSDVLAKRQKLDEQLEAIDRELAAVSAYEQVKKGKVVSPAPQKRMGGRRTGRRQEVLDLVKTTPEGLKRADILERLNIKGERSEEQSVSNALSALKRQGQLEQRDGKYVAA